MKTSNFLIFMWAYIFDNCPKYSVKVNSFSQNENVVYTVLQLKERTIYGKYQRNING